MTDRILYMIYPNENLVGYGERLSRSLARAHYENFVVGSLFVSKHLRQDLFNVYAFCRIADDIVDEPAEGVAVLDELNNWESEFYNALNGATNNPILAAVAKTINTHNLTVGNFTDLLKAFRLDGVKSRWKDWDDLREYTRFSADPVGRIVLELYGHRDAERSMLSDNICTALQLANHWQDVYEDFGRGRIYIPQDDMNLFNVEDSDIPTRNFTAKFRQLMEFQVERARNIFIEGKRLINMVARPLNIQLQLYYSGGMAALDAIESVDYDVLHKSAKVKLAGKFKVLISALGLWLK